MMPSRGDVVLVDWPFASGSGAKVRPALVVQADANNQRLANTIVAMITSRTQRALHEATQLLIDISTPEGRQTGLNSTSAVNCANLFTVSQQKILRTIGTLSACAHAANQRLSESILGFDLARPKQPADVVRLTLLFSPTAATRSSPVSFVPSPFPQ